MEFYTHSTNRTIMPEFYDATDNYLALKVRTLSSDNHIITL